MSYIVIPVYDFACDGKKASGEDCSTTTETVPANMGRPDEPLLTISHRLLRADGWTVRKGEDGWEHFCPAHKPARRKEVVPSEPVATSRDLGSSRQPVAPARAHPARATVTFADLGAGGGYQS